MKHCAEAAGRSADFLSSPIALSLPGMCAMMRNEFYPIMQCLEHSEDVLSKTYCVELALTLARLDAFLREEERRAFVCAFDSLVDHLLRGLHRATETEALLQQDHQLLAELADRCRAVDGACGSPREGSARRRIVSAKAVDASAANPVCVELQQLFGDKLDRWRKANSVTTSPTPSVSRQKSDLTAIQDTSKTVSLTPLTGTPVTPLLPVDGASPVPDASNYARWRCEEFRKFIGGHIPSGDVAALVDVFQRRHQSKKHSNSNSNNSTVGHRPMAEDRPTSSAVNAAAVHLSLLVDLVVHGRPAIVSSPNNSFGNVEEAEPHNSPEVYSQHLQQVHSRHTALEMLWPITIPTPAALSHLVKLFPSLRNCAVDFARLFAPVGGIFQGTLAGPTPGMMKSVEGISTMSIADSFTDAAASCILPVDVMLYAVFNALAKGCEGTIKEKEQEQEQEEEEEEKEGVPTGCTEDIVPESVTWRTGEELDIMIEQVQSAIASVRAIKEQIRTEVTLLVFRVVSTTMDLLIPAVYSVDQRALIFYRKWICDMYRLLLEEDLLARFNTMLGTAFPQQESPSHFQLQTQIHFQCQTQAASLAPPPPPQSQEYSRSSNTSNRRGLQHRQRMGTSKPISRHAPQHSPSIQQQLQQQEQPSRDSRSVSVNEVFLPERNLLQDILIGLDSPEDRAGAWIAPGTAYARHARRHAIDTASLCGPRFHPQWLMDSPAAEAEAEVPIPGLGHSFGLFDDPAVQLAESLLEDSATDAPVPHGYVLTRLMAAMMRGLSSDKLRRAAEASMLRTVNNLSESSTTSQQTPTPHNSAHRKRKTGTVSPAANVAAPVAKRQATLSMAAVESAALPHHHRFRYPCVSTAEGIDALYRNALLDAETVLSPHDPIRASLVQNVVDFLVTVLVDLRAAYDILDVYLEDVAVEKIQPVITRRALLDASAECEREPLASMAESPFTVTAVRRARQMPSGPPHAHEGKGLNPHAAARRGASGHAMEKDAGAGKWSMVPMFIPSWRSQGEREQFMEIAALLNREYVALREALAAAAPVMGDDENGKAPG